jgi:hypothetical protein
MLQCTKFQSEISHCTNCRSQFWNGSWQLAVARIHARKSGEPEMFRSWMRMTSDAFMLGLETQRVIGLRLMKLSRGGRAAETEALRMVTEKTSAWAEAGMTLARGGSAGSVIRRYRTHVRANTRRLLKP